VRTTYGANIPSDVKQAAYNAGQIDSIQNSAVQARKAGQKNNYTLSNDNNGGKINSTNTDDDSQIIRVPAEAQNQNIALNSYSEHQINNWKNSKNIVVY